MANNQPHERIYASRKTIFFNNFLGGIAWGLGATIGVSLLIALFAFLAGPLALVPIFGEFLAEVLKHATSSIQYGS